MQRVFVDTANDEHENWFLQELSSPLECCLPVNSDVHGTGTLSTARDNILTSVEQKPLSGLYASGPLSFVPLRFDFSGRLMNRFGGSTLKGETSMTISTFR